MKDGGAEFGTFVLCLWLARSCEHGHLESGYDVKMYYKQSGLFQKIARHPWWLGGGEGFSWIQTVPHFV